MLIYGHGLTAIISELILLWRWDAVTRLIEYGDTVSAINVVIHVYSLSMGRD